MHDIAKTYRRMNKAVALAQSGEAAHILAAAQQILDVLMRSGYVLTSPNAVRDYMRLALAGKEHEVFVVAFLDAQHRVLATEEMFRGTLTQTSVYPREVVKTALHHNAGAVIFAHKRTVAVYNPVIMLIFSIAIGAIPTSVPALCLARLT